MNPELFKFSPGAYLAPAVDWLNTNLHPFFDAIARLIEAVLGGIEAVLLYPPFYVVIVIAVSPGAIRGRRMRQPGPAVCAGANPA